VLDYPSRSCDTLIATHFTAMFYCTWTLENSEVAIQKGQSTETANIGYTRPRKTKEKHNTICVGHYHAQKKPEIT
jgi:hypothetical protein